MTFEGIADGKSRHARRPDPLAT